MVKIKVCGLTCEEDAKYLCENKIEFAGFVLFYPKSKRNISINTARKIFEKLDENIKKVAVTVSPTDEQINEISNWGFDYIQIHSDISSETLKNSKIPIIKAFNVSDVNKYEYYRSFENIVGFVFDANSAGSGQTFDWELLNNIERDERLFILAGGLNENNVIDAIKAVSPDIVDVSSGVENLSGIGKDPEKVALFAANARKISSIFG